MCPRQRERHKDKENARAGRAQCLRHSDNGRMGHGEEGKRDGRESRRQRGEQEAELMT